MPRPLGSPNKHKPFRAALERAIDKAGRDPEKLDRIAASLLAKAEGGDVSAIREVADRLDGKVAQPIAGSSENDPIKVVSRIERVIVGWANSDGAAVPPAARTGEA